MEGLLSVFTAFGLSSSAGLNAYIPLLVVALLARFSDLITLKPPWSALESWWAIGVLVVLLLIEVFVDKVPAVDSVNDVVQTFVRPAAGAILFAGSAGVISDAHPVLALICGLLVSGSVHAVKATARPIITGTTAGTLNPVVSTAEDVLAFLIALMAILVPILCALLMVVLVIWIVRRLRQRRRKTSPEWW
ncbi:DUF4126 domain-containing protein [Chloroflexota bacterium]